MSILTPGRIRRWRSHRCARSADNSRGLEIGGHEDIEIVAHILAHERIVGLAVSIHEETLEGHRPDREIGHRIDERIVGNVDAAGRGRIDLGRDDIVGKRRGGEARQKGCQAEISEAASGRSRAGEMGSPGARANANNRSIRRGRRTVRNGRRGQKGWTAHKSLLHQRNEAAPGRQFCGDQCDAPVVVTLVRLSAAS